MRCPASRRQLALKSSRSRTPRQSEHNWFNARPNWLCVVQSNVICGSPPVVLAGLKPPSTDSVAPHADSQSFFNDRVVCACTHYLVFKEPASSGAPTPDFRAPVAPGPPTRPRSGLARPRLGEPSKVTSRSFLCQPEFFGVAHHQTAGLSAERRSRMALWDKKIC